MIRKLLHFKCFLSLSTPIIKSLEIQFNLQIFLTTNKMSRILIEKYFINE